MCSQVETRFLASRRLILIPDNVPPGVKDLWRHVLHLTTNEGD